MQNSMDLDRNVQFEDLQSVCRCCLMVCSRLIPPLTSESARSEHQTTAQMYAQCVGPQMLLDSKLPIRICHKCSVKLNEFHLFRLQCLRVLSLFNAMEQQNGEKSRPGSHDEAVSPLNSDADGSTLSVPVRCRRQSSAAALRRRPLVSKMEKKKKITRPIMCQICGTMQTNITTHMLVHTGRKTFVCDMCQKVFSQKSNLRNHLLAHVNANVRRFTCETCGYAFRQKVVMQRHMLTHTNTRAFACDMCPRTFIQHSSMQKHRLSHMQVRNFVCPHCDKAFVGKSGLRNHVGIHTGRRDFGCFFCSRTFLNTSSAAMHRKMHRIDGVYVCPVCASFRTGDLRLFKSHWHDNHQRAVGETKSIGEMRNEEANKYA